MVKKEVTIRRIFSTEFKKSKVNELEAGKISVLELSKIYSVSQTSIYKWLKLFGSFPSSEIMVVEKVSEAKKTLHYMNRVGELEQTIGKMHLELEAYKELIFQINKDLGYDVKKKLELK